MVFGVPQTITKDRGNKFINGWCNVMCSMQGIRDHNPLPSCCAPTVGQELDGNYLSEYTIPKWRRPLIGMLQFGTR